MSSQSLVENEKIIPFIDKPFQEDLNILEKDILFFTNKCDKIEAEIKAPGNKKDYLVLQKIWKYFLELDSIEKIEIKLLKLKNYGLENIRIIDENTCKLKTIVDRITDSFICLIDLAISQYEREINSNKKLYFQRVNTNFQDSYLIEINDYSKVHNSIYNDRASEEVLKYKENIKMLEEFKKKVVITKYSVERLNVMNKQSKINSEKDLSLMKTIKDNQLNSDNSININGECCLITTIVLLITILIVIIVAFYWKLHKTFD